MIAPWLALLAAVSLPDTTSASAPVLDTLLVLPEVRVERTRPLSPAARRVPTGFVSEAAAGTSGRALESVPELLSDIAGVRVTQYGGLGAFATVSLRGAPPGQVGVYLDGAPITSAAQGVVNLSDLPFAPIERIEVYRGASPLALGAASPGGAINLVTLSSPGLLRVELARGSYQTWEGRASAGAARGPVALTLHGGYRGSDGDYAYFNDNATPFNPADDSMSTRTNNRLDAANALAMLRVSLPRAWQLTAREHLLRKDQGLAGVGTRPALHPSLALDRSLTQLDLGREIAGAWPSLRAHGAWQREHSQFRDTGGELRPGRSDRDDHFTSASGALESEWRAPGSWLLLEGALATRAEEAELHDAADGRPDPPVSTRDSRGAMAAVGLQPLGERLLLRAARRWDAIEDQIATVNLLGVTQVTYTRRVLDSPQLGARLRVARLLELRANWSDAVRAPDFGELFGDQGSVMGNPALRPEHGENWDAGGRLELASPGRGTLALEYAHFESNTDDLIVYLRNSPNTIKAANVSRAEIRGDELGARLAAPFGVVLSGSMTWMDAVDRGAVKAWYGKRLPGRPERSGNAHLTWTRRALRVDGDVSYLGENFLDPYNRQPVGSRTLVGAALSVAPWGDALRVTVEGKNLGDRRAFDVGGFPLPGRSVFVSLGVRHGTAGHAQL